MREDKCRVCGGNGSTCRTVEGVYEQSTGLHSGYNDILLIPAGATNIMIREMRATSNYLAIRNTAGDYYLNGNWHIQHTSVLDFAGSKFHYQRNRTDDGRQFNQLEILKSLGPTSEPLFVVLLYQEPHQGIFYEYSVPFSVYHGTPGSGSGGEVDVSSSGMGNNQVRYAWIFGDYSACSRSCGTGVQRRDVFCAAINPQLGKQDAVQASLCDPTSKPADTRPCSSEPCPASWQLTEWSECCCVNRVQLRNVYCSSQPVNDGEAHEDGLIALPDEVCLNITRKPDMVRRCQVDESTCPYWVTRQWSEVRTFFGLPKNQRI